MKLVSDCFIGRYQCLLMLLIFVKSVSLTYLNYFERLLLPYEKWKKGDELQPVPKKRKKQKFLKVPFRNELDNKPPSAENENLKPDVKNEPTELKEEVPVVKEAVKPEKIKVKSEEIGRKEEIQNRALIIKQELENMKIRKVSNNS